MDTAIMGFLAIFIPIHVLFVAIPVRDTLRATISTNSKMLWCGFLLFVPLIGAALFHYKYKTGLFQGGTYEISAAEERARSGTLAPRDDD